MCLWRIFIWTCWTINVNSLVHRTTHDQVLFTNTHLTPNDPYMGRTAPLTSKHYILYIYSTNTGTEYLKHALYSPFFSLQNAVCFIMLTCLFPVLFTFYIQDVLKLKEIIPAPKGYEWTSWRRHLHSATSLRRKKSALHAVYWGVLLELSTKHFVTRIQIYGPPQCSYASSASAVALRYRTGRRSRVTVRN